MSFPKVLERGDDFLKEFPRSSILWQYASHATCMFMILGSKVILNTIYTPKVEGLEKLDAALLRSKNENRSLITVMNHMSVVDDPSMWGMLPLKYYWGIDNIRWCLGAQNLCFKNKVLTYFFSLGKVLPTERFGRGPFQGSIDATIRLLSPDDTLDLEYVPSAVLSQAQKEQQDLDASLVKSSLLKQVSKLYSDDYKLPVIRTKPSWVHVFPEGFVCQLQQPHSNSMRYFKWGISRLVLEATRPPIVLPIFATGFEKIAPESAAEDIIQRYLPANYGAEIKLTIGDPVDDDIIFKYRKEWEALCEKYYDPENPYDLSQRLKTGKEAKELRSRLAAEIRQNVLNIRDNHLGFRKEDSRLQSPSFWKEYTATEGASAPDIKFIGKNWAIRRLQSDIKEYDEDGNEISKKQ
ncbi:hypothetical protein PACTADRAFT_36951 [Pachysolen tannophilus NRRL Y-2460]|uniref:Tafazzin family protein n=1 Tax=Pachysolen tannophilus NRRL Y-2460 TaxID=669874 RepID=A0A1E4U0Y0_PACTA|nr:hypothetical protein PACTADRAFT_36951 [Pachysolen tannophilus NRRL Y-2460]